MVGGHVTESSVRRALALILTLLLVAVGLIAGTPSARAIVPASVQTFQGRIGFYNASTSFMTGACSVASSATINLPPAPAGATIDTAYLVWAASGNTADTTATVNGTPVSGVAVTDFFDPTEGYFQTRTNITSLVTTAGGTFTIADITSATGAPWCTYSTVMKSATIYVFYEDPTEPVSQLNFYSGLEIVYGSETTVTVSHGPLAPSATGTIEVLLYEGDAGLSGSRNGFRERFRVNGTVTSSGNNQWNSSTGIAIDMDTMAVPAGALTAGATSTQLRMSSGNDFVLLSSFILESQIQAADIAIGKSVDNPQPDPGDTVTYTVTATNNGVDTSTGVQVTDALPVGVTFASAAATQGTYNAGTGIWAVGTLASGATVTLTVVATVDAGTVGNTIVNTATKSGGSGLDVDAMNNTASASLTVRGADLAISKTIDNATPNPGDMITYTVTAVNSGPTNTTGVAISDGLPPGLTLVSASATNGSYVGSTWTVGALPTGASAILTIIATVDAGTAGSDIVNTASVLSNDLVDPVAGNNSASAQLRVPLVDIAVTKTTNNATPLPGDTFTYTVAATNNGPDTATGVTVDDVIPAALTLTGVSATQGSYTADTWSVGSLASGATETMIFTVSVPAGTTGGTATNTAAVSGVNETESSTANNSASAVVTIAQSDISITKTVDVATPNPGDAVTYTVTVTNNGPDAATGVVVADSLPNGVTETASSASQGSFTEPTWTVGALASGASATLTINATVNTGTAGTNQNNTAIGSSDQADPDLSNNVAGADIAIPAVDLSVTKTVSNSAPNPSDMITYTVSVTNNGPDTATAVAVADTVPSGVTFVSASPSQGSYASGVWTVGTITNGGNATLTIVTTVDVGTAGTTITNTASLLSVSETDVNGTNDSDTAAIGVPAVDLAVTKTASAPNPNPGQTATYTVTVANSGPDTATGILLTDNIPAGLVVTGTSATQGTFTGSTWNVGSLTNGSTATLTITATITAAAVGTTVTNLASIDTVTETDIDLSNDSDSASFAVPATDLEVTKTVSNPGPNPGDVVTYTISVSNNGPDTATGITLNDSLPSEVSLNTASTSQGSYSAPTWMVGSLVPGASATLTITATVLPAAAGLTVTNTASVSAVSEADTDLSNDSASASFSSPAIDLAVNKTVDAPFANPGDSVTFSIVVTNTGPNNATGVSITDALPIGVTLTSSSVSVGSYSAPTWTIGTLASGASETLTITATVDAGTAGTTITNVAAVAAAIETDIDPSNDSDSASVVIPAADLAINKVVDDANPLPGDTIMYTVTVTNNGPSTATGILMADSMPPGVTLISATPSQGSYTDPTWTVGGLGNGATATLTIVATVDAGTPGTSIANTASVVALNETDLDSSNDSATSTIYVSAVDLAVTKTASTALAQVGDAVSYTVTVTNNGPDTASGVTINDSVPSGVTLVSASFSQGSYAAGVWTVGSIPSGATQTLTLNVTVIASGAGSIVTNTAAVGAVGETDTDPSNDSDSAAFGVPAVDIAVTKTVDNPTPVPGATVTYLVTVANAGPSPASGVSIADALPSGLTMVSATPSQGSYLGSTWTIGTLSIASSVTLVIVATVDTGTAGTTITNTASVAGVFEYDSDVSNNSDSTPITVSAVDLSVTKTVDDATPNPGDIVTFTVTVANAGPEVATGVSLIDALPAGVTLVSAATSQGSLLGPTWTVGTLGVATSATLAITATVDAGTAGTAITNTATVASVDQIDIDLSNDSASTTIDVPLTDVAITKTVDDVAPNPGEAITYTITVSNPSSDTATGVVVADSLPLGLTLSSTSTSQGSYVGTTWTVGALNAGASATLTIVATVDAGTAGSTISNTATVTNVNETESNTANNTDFADLTVNAVDLAVTKSVSDIVPNPGDTITYTVDVTNTGPSAATGVTINDSIPSGVTLVSASATSGSFVGSTWTVGTVAAGATETLLITVTVDAGTAGSTITNTASVGSVIETDVNPANDSASSTLSVPAVDVSLSKVVDNTTPNEGDTVTFTVTATNLGPDDATGVVVSDPLPPGLTATSVIASTGTYTAGSWSVGPLASGVTETLTITVAIDTGTAGTTITNTASSVGVNETDTNANNDTAAASVTVNAVDIAVTKTVDNAAPNPGDTIIYTVTVGNNGPNTATGVTLADALPIGVTLVSASASQGSYIGSTWTIGTLASGGSATLTITASIDASTEGATLTNTASLSTVTETDINPVNDSVSVDLVVQLVDVAISKVVDNTTPNPGDTVTYTVTIANSGPDGATGVVVTDNLPVGVTLVSAGASQGIYSGATWMVGTLAAGQSETLTIIATIDMGTQGSTITNTAAITAVTETESDLLNNSVSVDINVNAVDLAVTKTVSNPAPNPGDAVSYIVTVTNNGPDAATGVTLGDSLPAGVTLVGSSASQGSYVGSTWTVGTLASGASATLTINVTVDTGTAGSTIVNTVAVASVAETDTDVANDTANASLTVPAVDLTLAKTVDDTAPNEGDTIIYTVAITNNGPDSATGVEITDTLPAGVTLVSVSVTQGSVAGSVWSVGSLANAAVATLTITATVDTGTAGTVVVNTAAVTGVSETDTDTANDTDAASIDVPAVNLIVAKSVNDTTPNPGESITYTIQVTNGGPDTATGVALLDALPTGVTLVSASTSQGSYSAPTWTVSSITSGSTATLTIVATVDSGTEGSTILNTASVSAVNETDTDPANDSDDASINVPAVDVTVSKVVDTATANPGATVTFTITAGNSGPGTATGVVITDVLPAGLTLLSATPSLGSMTGSTWTVGALGAGASATLTIVTTVDSGTAGSTIMNTATLTGVNEVDTDPSNDSSAATVSVNAVDVTVTKTVDNATPNPGDTIVYTVSVSNLGPDAATGVTLVDALPTGTTLVGVVPSQGSYVGSTWTVGTISSGAAATLTLTVTVDVGTAGSTIVNTATVTQVNETDRDPGNDSDSVSVVVPAIDLAVTKTVDNPAAVEGETITYTVVVTNTGPDSASSVEITDTLPAGTTLVSTSTTQGSVTGAVWSVGAVAVGGGATLTIIATVDAGTAGTTLVNTATLSASTETDTNPTNDSDTADVTVQAVDIVVAKTVDSATAQVGDTVTFTVSAMNIGPDTATSVVISDPLPAGLSYTSGSPSQGGYVAATGTWTVGTIPAGATATLTMTATVDAGTPGSILVNTATVASVAETDTDPGNDSASASVAIPAVDIALTKAVTAATANPGDPLTYTITITNNGPDAATGVDVTDVLPTDVTLVASSTSQGSLSGSVWVVGSLGVSSSATLTYDVTVNTGTEGSTITNTASVTGVTQDDTDVSNNSASASTSVNAVDLVVAKSVDIAVANPGDPVTYTVTVTNNGPDTATGVTITDTLPAGTTLVSSAPSQGTYAGSTWTVGTLTNGTTATLTIAATVDAGATGTVITNTATLSGVTETDTDPSNDTASATFTVNAVDIAVAKTVDVTHRDLHRRSSQHRTRYRHRRRSERFAPRWRHLGRSLGDPGDVRRINVGSRHSWVWYH